VQATLLPGILKTCRMGYDGKGQARVANRDELLAAWDRLGRVPCVLEQRLPLAQECSVVLARGWDGHMVHFAPTLNLHREGILAVTEAWGGVLSPSTAEQAVRAARTLAEGLGYVGVLCVEFFLLQPDSAEAAQLGELVVNEMAPRPHNSGHHTLDSCDQSQFDLQVRALAGLPLVQPRQHSAAVMLNLLGDLWPEGGSPATQDGVPPWDQVLSLPGAHLHLYGKQRALPGRKMGHITLTGADPQAVRRTALQAAAVLGIAPF
jgi:5-(carboxyamino)imidazole ribonucleotide synthase